MNRGSLARACARNGLAAVALLVAGCARQPPPLPPAPVGDAREGRRPAQRLPAVPSPSGGRRAAPESVRRPAALESLAFDPIVTSSSVREGDIRNRIDWWIEYWRTRSSASFQRGLVRMGQYREFVEAELAKRGLPASLVYLPLIEANYYPPAVSPAGAAGLWQFMPQTARGMGLRVDGIVDERFDPFVATPAALDYIVELNRRFGSWFLTLAAYNAGPGRVESAIRRHGGGDPREDELFVRIRERLPSETRDFIPKYLAAVRMADTPAYHGLPNPASLSPMRFDTTMVEGAATIDVIARAAGVEEEDVERLNPHLVAGVTSARGSTTVRLPEGRVGVFRERFATIPPHERVGWHIVSAGETLSHIAVYYRITVDMLRAANPGVEPRRLQIGARLVIPAYRRSPPPST